MIQGQTKKFLAQNPNAKEPVDDVIACADIETILNSKDFYDRGVKIVSIAPKDRSEYFGTGKAVKVGIKVYWDTLKNNRAIQMLVVSASTDKLASTAKTGAVTTVL